MKNREKLEQAIADAKTIKEISLINATEFLKESFNPRVKELLNRRS